MSSLPSPNDDDYATVVSISPQPQPPQPKSQPQQWQPQRQPQPPQPQTPQRHPQPSQPQPQPQPQPPQRHPQPPQRHPQPPQRHPQPPQRHPQPPQPQPPQPQPQPPQPQPPQLLATGSRFTRRPQQHNGRTPAPAARRQQQPLVRTASTSGGHPTGWPQRQLSIINAVSFAVFLANVVAAVAVLVLFSRASVVGAEDSASQDWISLAIGDNTQECNIRTDRQCREKSSRTSFLAGDKNIGPLACSQWSKESGHCHADGPTFKLLDGGAQVAIQRGGHYRIHLMATSHEKNKRVKFFIVIDDKEWIHCSSNNVTAGAASGVYTRCFITAVRFLKPRDNVAFKCSDERCTVNSFEKVTYFGLERL